MSHTLETTSIPTDNTHPRADHTVASTSAVVETGTLSMNDAKAVYRTVDEEKLRSSSSLRSHNKRPVDPAMTGEVNALAVKEEEDIENEKAKQHNLWGRIRPFALTLLALGIVGWWISAIIIQRQRWYVSSPFIRSR